jgi:hypothetical protein
MNAENCVMNIATSAAIGVISIGIAVSRRLGGRGLTNGIAPRPPIHTTFVTCRRPASRVFMV